MTAMHDSLRQQLGILAETGGQQFDPARFAYIESLIRRVHGKAEGTRCQIEQKALNALADFREDFDRTKKETTALMEHWAAVRPDSTERLRRLLAAGDFKGIKRMTGRLGRANTRSELESLTDRLLGKENTSQEKRTSSTLDDLLQQQEEEVLLSADTPLENAESTKNKSDPGLKTFPLFKKTWEKFYSDRLVTRAVKERPENAGPLNSQLLVTRSLFEMRRLSPEYLNRFVSYIDTLLWLEQAGEVTTPRAGVKRNRHK